MKIRWLIALMLALASPAGAQRAGLYGTFPAPCDSAAVTGTIRHFGGTVTAYTCPPLGRLGVVTFTIPVTDLALRPWLLDSLRVAQRPDSTRVFLDVDLDRTEVVQPAPQVDGPSEAASWGLDSLRVQRAWALGATGAGDTIAILDTGFDPGHQEFAGRVVFCGSLNGLEVVEGGCGQVTSSCNWHGQHVAGTAGGATVGVAPGTRLVLIRTYSDIGGVCGNGASNRIAAENAAKARWPGIVAVNHSTGGAAYVSEMITVQNLFTRGTTVCGAAGNSNYNGLDYPAGYPWALGIGALNSNLTRASYSNYGDSLDFALPGSSIYSAYGPTGYSTKSGTSMAAPHCTGLIALACSVHRCADSSDVRTVWDAMRASAKDLGTAGRDRYFGWGMPRADRMVAALLGLDQQPTTTAGQVLAARGSSGCVPVDGTVLWRTAPGDASPWLTITSQGNGQLCYTVAADAPVGASDTLHLEIDP